MWKIMIEYDYVMEKNDGYETKEFKPLFDKTIPNVVTFRGHNSSGKSTFMDLIALSLYGIDSPEVISKLKEKLEYLKNADNSDFIFNLLANNCNVSLRVHSQKTGFIEGNGEWECSIEESLDGDKFTELTKEKFRKKYRVIYDMPDRPMERVQELVREAERIIRSTRDSIDSFRYSVSNEQSKAENSRNEEIIFLIKNELDNKRRLLIDTNDDLDQLKKILKKIQQFYYSSEFTKLYSNKDELQNKIDNLNKEKTKKKKENAKENKDYEMKLRSIKNQLRTLVNEYRIVCNNLDSLDKIDPQDIQSYKQFGNITQETILIDECSQLYDFRKQSKYLIGKIEDTYKNDNNALLSDKKKLLGELVTALEPYITDKIEVLESPVKTLYDKLTEEFDAIQEQLGQYGLVQDILYRIDKANKAAKEAEDAYDSLGSRPISECSEEDSGIYTSLNARKNAIIQQINNIREDAARYNVTADTFSKINEDCRKDILLKDFVEISLDDLKIRVDQYLEDIQNKEQKIIDLRSRISRLEQDLTEAESKDPHPLSEYKNELKILLQCINSTIRDFDSKSDILNTLSQEKKVPENEETLPFLELVWTYLGKRLDTIQHIGQNYIITKIDMNNRVIYTESGSKIQFKDMGTGESQLAYITGLLNSDDDRITIALFDEIDHMDPIIISKIQHQLKSLFDEGKLLIGIMAAPAAGTEVEPCE